MLEPDKQINNFIEILEKGNDTYKLATTIPDFFIDANFNKDANDNYILSFVLQPSELEKGLDLDYFFQRPFVLVSNGISITVQNHDVVNGNEEVKRDTPREFRIEVKAFRGDNEESLWKQSKLKAYIRYNEKSINPWKSGIIFDLTTNSKDNGFYNAIQLNVDGVELLFYHERVTPEYGYYIFNAKPKIDFVKFERIINSIITASGFLNGSYIQDTVYFFAQKESKGKKVMTYSYENCKRSICSTTPIIESSRYHDIPSENLQLSSIQFNNLVNLFYSNEEYLRSALLLINAGTLKGCAKASLGAVALETISKTIREKSLTSQIVEDKSLIRILLKNLKKTLESYSDRLNDSQIRILSNKLDNINSKPNASKLEDAFKELDIILDNEEKVCINSRNLFLHGNLPRAKDYKGLKDLEFLDIMTNRLVMLSSILLLKKAGFNGMVIDWGMTEVIKWRMIRKGQKVPSGNCLRNISARQED